MLNRIIPKQAGFGLVELMIAVVLGLIVIGGTISVFVSALTTNTASLKMTHLNQELRAVMMMLTRDLRRAGHWGLARDTVTSSFNGSLTLSATSGSNVTITSSAADTFSSFGINIVGMTLKHVDSDGNSYGADIVGYTSNSQITADISAAFPSTIIPAGTWTILNPLAAITIAGGNCILFTYDTNTNGVADANEQYGFRLDATDKTVETRQAGSDCASGGWANLTDENSIEITSLTITDSSPTPINTNGFTITIRELTIELTGRLKNDISVTRTLRETVKIRNDQII